VECELIEGELVPFHFGNLAGDVRAAVEGHLCGCARCLQAYLEVKRAIETGAGLQRRPSAGLRSRLRAQVAMEVAPPRASRLRVVAVAALLVGAVGLGVWSTREPPVRPPELPSVTAPEPHEDVDTARPVSAGPQFL
jgi:hypothetical protein